LAQSNKRSLTVDVKRRGKSHTARISQDIDIFFENYAPGVAGRLGLGYEALSEINPRLIYCSLSGYGQDGPYRDVKAYDLLIQGEGGIIATTGYPDKPARAGSPSPISPPGCTRQSAFFWRFTSGKKLAAAS
jgi:crotonobetainyl-CoA:carnitine CoA-transferase CaiB-like acyl-CoA transferase